MALGVDVTDDEPSTEADVVLKIDYDPNTGSAARAFEIAANLIRSLEDMDRVFAQTIHLKLETALVVEDLKKSSLKIFLRNVIREIPDDALKDFNIKKIIGHFLVKSKYAAIRWLDEPENQRRDITELTEEIAAIAKETDIRHLPDYPPPNPSRLAQPLDRFQEAKLRFNRGESLTITLGKEDYKVHLDSHWLPSEQLASVDVEKHLVNEQDIFLIIGKPDFLGNAKWTFRHGKKSLALKIDDEEWVSNFRQGMYPIKPGDALRVRMRIEYRYDAQGNLVETTESVVRVFDVIEGPGTSGDLFDGD